MILDLDVPETAKNRRRCGQQHFPFAPFDVHFEEIDGAELMLPQALRQIDALHRDGRLRHILGAGQNKPVVRGMALYADLPFARRR